MSMKKKLVKSLATIGGVAAYLYTQNRWIEKTEYVISLENLDSQNEGIKIAHLSDFHMPNQDINLDTLVEMIEEEQPDFIFMTGDQVDAANPFDVKETTDFFKQLTNIAPVYAVNGNHDIHSPNVEQLQAVYEESGVTLLIDDVYSVLLPGRRPIVIMGLAEPATLLQKQLGDPMKSITIRDDWQEQTRLLLAHRPERFEKYHQDSANEPDLTFSGHAHGGQIRIPKIGGLFSPGQGKMPKHTAGVFVLGSDQTKKMVISRGLGPSQFPLRINNRPELVMVTLKKPSEDKV